ncbi:MAG TPA: hypothetical protein VN628_19475 [Vicinamibacterales bacterium]|nr:hypothetical protein [Vicinamibacterales bacterium]
MIIRLALRSLAVRPVRTGVLALGFGLGIAVMAALLGVGDVILEQARSPALAGGGDMIVFGAFGMIENAPYVLSSVRNLAPAASPSRRETIYLLKDGQTIPVIARGGVPSLEKAIGDAEVRNIAAWTDAPSDARWTHVDQAAVLREFDRFHPQPDVPEFADSWAEWLYFNGRTSDGRVRFYLTYIFGPEKRPGIRSAAVRLQLDRDGRTTNYGALADVDGKAVLERAPDVDIGRSSVRLEHGRYRLTLNVPGASGVLTLDPAPGRSLPPAVLHGARGWLSGYVVPVLSGKLSGTLSVNGEDIPLTGASGYHDHNWGFWKDVHWQWGQVSGGDLSFIYGRVFPPADVAAPDRIPGFFGVLDNAGLVAVATNVFINEHRPGGDARAAPSSIDITARGSALDLRLSFATDRTVRTALSMTGGANDFLQLGGSYRVKGRAAGRTVDFTARGAAETFQPR